MKLISITPLLLVVLLSLPFATAVDLPKFCVATISKKDNKVKDGERVIIKRYSEFDKDGDFNTVFLKELEMNEDREVLGVTTNEKEFKKDLDDTKKELLWYLPSSTPFNGEVFRHSKILEKEVDMTVIPCLYPVKEITEETFDINFPFPMPKKEKQRVSRKFDFFEDSQTEKPAHIFAKKLGGVMNSLNKKSNVLAHGSGAQAFEKLEIAKKKIKNLFLVSPDIDEDIFTNSPQVDHSKKAKEHITESSDKLHLIYNPEDRMLKESVKRHNGFHRLGERGVVEDKIDNSIDNLYQGNASGKIGFSDPWRNHFYVISERMVNYIRNEISPTPNMVNDDTIDNDSNNNDNKR
tara:strand:+ start:533 stop:1582 length:1050 start_codon:yes stop_codon:yes gene_type:complete